MDYGGGSFLTQAQWKKIQNPGVIINWFDDAEDAQFSQVAACISSAALDMAMNYVFKWVEVNFLDQNPNNNYSLTDFKNIWASSDKWEVFSSAGIACGASLIPLPTDKAKLVGVAMASFGAGGVALIADAGNQYDKLPANLGFTAKIQRVNWEQSFKKAGIQAFIAGVATGVTLYAIDHPRFRNFAATLRGIGYAKVKQIMTQSGFSDDASDAFCRRFGLQIVSGAGKHPNWVEVTGIANKVEDLTPHVLKVETNANGAFIPKSKTIGTTTFNMEGFKGCHTENALKDYVQANGGTYVVKNKSVGIGGVYEGQPVIYLNNKEYVKINGQFVEYQAGKLGGTSSFFPENWSNAKIKVEVEFAIANNHG